MKANKIFTPGAFPVLTYVAREGETLERALRDALDTPGQVISLVGPSKSGKTVLVERVVGVDKLVTITGAGIEHTEDIWNRILDSLEEPDSETTSSSSTRKLTAGIEAGGQASILGMFGGSAKATGGVASDAQSGDSSTSKRRGLKDVIDLMAGTGRVLLIDDFHYMPREVQSDAARSLKEAVRRGVQVVTAAVLHRGDDLVRANPELRGRVRSIDLTYWHNDELRAIGKTGFELLNAKMGDYSIDKLADEAAGSPQLMQLLCLTACFVLGLRQKLPRPTEMSISPDDLRTVFEQSSANTDFRSLVDVLDDGPRTRGTERKLYKFSDHTSGDVYRAVLKAVAADPPMLSFSYEELQRRTSEICV